VLAEDAIRSAIRDYATKKNIDIDTITGGPKAASA
jgi:hypothetical protein